MSSISRVAPDWRNALAAVARAWKPLFAYELLVSLLATLVLGPLLFACSYLLIGISDDSPSTNFEIARFLLSPRGVLALVLVPGAAIILLFLQYSGLILLADAALRGRSLSVGQLVAAMLAAAPRLCVLALLHAAMAILLALPFAGLAALAYWLLLSGTDINFYLTERPPRFWMAVLVGGLLLVALGAATIWVFARWAFAVPACVLEGQGWRDAMRLSARYTRGRAVRLLWVFGGWQLLKGLVLAIALAALDQLHEVLFASFDQRLTFLVWSTAAWLLIDAIMLQLLAAALAIGTAVLIAREYEQARQSLPGTDGLDTGLPASRLPSHAYWPARLALVALLIAGPAASLAYAIVLARDLVEYHPARVTAHRAGPSPAPENSLAALRLALAAGAECVEIDVQQTADGHVVLLHDRDLKRVTGDARVLQDVTLAELQELRLRGAGVSTDQRVPTLVEFLAACGDRIRLNVELKEVGRNPRLAKAVVGVLREQGFIERAGVSCFELPALLEVRAAEPRLPIGAILTAVKGDMTRLPVNFLSLNARLVNGEVVRRAHLRGMEVHVWTVNDRASALRLLDLGCDNLITSNPALMREVVDDYGRLADVERMLLRLRRWMRE